MSVIKSKRSLSELEFFHNALCLRRSIATLLLRDFGTKDKIRSVKMLENLVKMNDEDKKTLDSIFTKYNISKVSEEWPEWLLSTFRNSLYELSRNIVLYIVAANSIYPMSMIEFNQRRELQNAAIYSCDQLLIEMQFVISILPVKAEKLQAYIESIEKERFLLKRWRKSDNRIANKIKDKQNNGVLYK